jgi:hypothetical protein
MINRHSHLSEEDFAGIVADRICKSVQGSLFFDKQQFALLVKDDLGRVNQKLNLNNFYKEYCRADGAIGQESVLKQLIETQQARPKHTFEEARPKLFLHVRDRWTVEEWKLNFQLGRIGPPDKVKNFSIPSFQLGDMFSIVVALDLPNTRMIVTSTQLDSWGQDFNTVVDIAYRNLKQRTHGTFETWFDKEKQASAAHTSTWNDHYDASRVLMTDLVRCLSVDGKHVVGMPTSDRLLIAGSESAFGLAVLSMEYENAKKEGRALAPFPLVLENEEYCPMQLSGDNPSHCVLIRLQMEYLAGIYQMQKELLDAQHEHLMGNMSCGTYRIMQNRDDRLVSYTTISKGQRTLIPKADFVVFVEQTPMGREKILGRGNWERVMGITGQLFQKTDHFPERYVVQHFPSVEQLRLIGEEPLFV